MMSHSHLIAASALTRFRILVAGLLYVASFSAVYSFTNHRPNVRGDGSSSVKSRQGLELWMGGFNPFTSRSKNTKVRWFDNELTTFYTYVENQPLLTHQQELQYGKALSMWGRVVNQKKSLYEQKQEQKLCQLASSIQYSQSRQVEPDGVIQEPFGHLSGAISSNGIPTTTTHAAEVAAASVTALADPAVTALPDVTDQFEAAIADGKMLLTNGEMPISERRVIPRELFSLHKARGPLGGEMRVQVADQGTEKTLGDAVVNRGAEAANHFVSARDVPVHEEEEEEDGDEVVDELFISEEEVAESMGCSTKTLEKIRRCAEISRIRLVNSNLKLVLAVVSRYRTSAIPNAELIAEGTRGLARAVDRYDYSKGFRFATYATWYVHQAISDYVRWRKHPAKMPSRYLLLQRKVKEFTMAFKQENKRYPGVTEISEKLGQSEFDVMKVMTMNAYPILLTTPMQASRGVQSRNSDTKNEKTIEETIASKYKSPAMRSESEGLRQNMERLMRTNLNDVERDVLRLRLGLDDGRSKAVKEVGKRFKISWKEVRTVEQQALTKLLGSEQIKGFVENFDDILPTYSSV